MRENRLSGLMRGGKQTVIGLRASQSVASRLLYRNSPRPRTPDGLKAELQAGAPNGNSTRAVCSLPQVRRRAISPNQFTTMTTLKSGRPPYPLGATVTPEGVNFALFSERHRRRSLPVRSSRRAGGDGAHPHDGADGSDLALLPARGRSRASFTATASTGRTSRRRGTASTTRSCCSIRMRRRSPGSINWGTEMFGYPQDGAEADLHRDYRDDAWGMPKCVVVDDDFDWGDDRRPNIPFDRDGHLRGAREGLLAARARGAGENPRHVCRPRQRVRDRVFQEARRHGGGAAAGAAVRERPVPRGQGAEELLGLQLDRLLRAALRLLEQRLHRRSRSRSSSRW